MALQLQEDGHDVEDFKKVGEPGERVVVKVSSEENGKDLASNLVPSEITEKRKLRRQHIRVEVNEH